MDDKNAHLRRFDAGLWAEMERTIMIDKILAALGQCGIESYCITQTQEETAELFFVKKQLNMQRCKKKNTATVAIYRAFSEGEDRFRGVSSVEVDDSRTPEELCKMFRDAYYAAGFVKNKYYDLYQGSRHELVDAGGSLSGMTLKEIVQSCTEALFAEDVRSDVFINSAEIFAHHSTVRIVSSNGVDVAYRKSRLQGEFVVQCVVGQDVETYQDFAYTDWKPDALKAKVREAIEMTEARAKATAACPSGEYRVILMGANVDELMSYYVSRSSSGMIYPKYSTFSVGCDVQGGDVENDRINMTLKAVVPFSNEGIPMRDRELVKDGKLMLIHGGNRFAQYLGIEPTGQFGGRKIPAGTVSLAEMRSEPYLEVVNFSDFQMSAETGNFGGEIRLAFLYDGEKVTPITGGSINGNILEAQKHLVFSKEMQMEKDFEGPKAVCVGKVNVAGV